MSVSHNLIRNTIYPIVSRLLADLLFIGFYILLSRRFGSHGIGMYSFSLAFCAIFFSTAGYGLSTYMIREVSRNREALHVYLGNFILLKGVLMMAAVLFMSAVLPFFRLTSEAFQVLLIVGVSQWMFYFTDVLISSYTAHEELSEIAFTEVFYKFSILVLGCTFYFLDLSFNIVLTAFPLSAFGYLMLTYWRLTKRYGQPSFRVDFGLIAESMRGAMPFFVSNLLASLYFRMNPILLNYFRGFEAVGHYAAPYKLAETLMIFVNFFRLSLFSTLSRLYHESDHAHKRLCENAFRYILLLFIPISVLLFLAADEIILFLFGSGFAESIPVLQILSIYVIFAAMRNVVLAALGSVDNQWQWVASQCVGVVIGFASGIVLIPAYGVSGAALSLTGSEIAAFLVSFWFSAKHLGRINLAPGLRKPVVASLVMACFVIWVPNRVPILFTLPIAAFICLVSLIGMGSLGSRELSQIKHALLNRTARSQA